MIMDIVQCKDCVYWQHPQILTNDGEYVDYPEDHFDEYGFPTKLVTLEDGINIASHCTKYNRNHENRFPQYMGPKDGCTKGELRVQESS